MMTKKEYAQMIIDRYKRDNQITTTAELHRHIFSSSSLAVAMEFLGLLTEDEMCYSRSRGGCIEIYHYPNPNVGEPIIRILSVRDMLKILPWEISEEDE